jgi:hypothetical protein
MKLQLDPAKALAAFVPEFVVAGTTGFACTEDGQHAQVRVVDEHGETFVLIIPADGLDALIGGLQEARKACDLNNGGERKIQVRIPARWDTATAPMEINGRKAQGVIVAFDANTDLQTVVGLTPDAARALAKGMIAQAQKASERQGPRLILPDHMTPGDQGL